MHCPWKLTKDELIADPYRFIRDDVAPRKYGLMRMPYRMKARKYNEDRYYFRFRALGLHCRRFKDEPACDIALRCILAPLDLLLDSIRDFAGTKLDIKRNPNKVAEACEALLPMFSSCSKERTRASTENRFLRRCNRAGFKPK
jgi:hypothetical protein